ANVSTDAITGAKYLYAEIAVPPYAVNLESGYGASIPVKGYDYGKLIVPARKIRLDCYGYCTRAIVTAGSSTFVCLRSYYPTIVRPCYYKQIYLVRKVGAYGCSNVVTIGVTRMCIQLSFIYNVI